MIWTYWKDNHSIPKQWREEILHQLIGMKSHVLGFSILQPSTIPDPKGVWGSRFRLRTLHTKMFGRLTEGIEKGSKQGYTLRQSDVAMGTSTPFVDVLSEHGGFSLLLFWLLPKVQLSCPKLLSEQPMRSWLYSHNGSTRVSFHFLHATLLAITCTWLRCFEDLWCSRPLINKHVQKNKIGTRGFDSEFAINMEYSDHKMFLNQCKSFFFVKTHTVAGSV